MTSNADAVTTCWRKTAVSFYPHTAAFQKDQSIAAMKSGSQSLMKTIDKNWPLYTQYVKLKLLQIYQLCQETALLLC